MAEKFIKEATKNKGVFRKQAERAGMTTEEYAHHVLRKDSHAHLRTKRRAQLALNLAKLRKRRRS
jgi:hypothetical protein